jgi:hypothetical protein
MKTLACLAVAGSLAACMESGASNTTPDPATALPSDAHFVAVFSPYASPEECVANAAEPRGCLSSLSLCKSGRAGRRLGDIVEQGAYDMIDSIAHVSFTDGTSLGFDVEAVVEIGSPDTHWIIDTERRWETLQFDNIDCSEL